MSEEWEELFQRWPLGNIFNLPPESVVLVVGAYKGLAMEALANRYPEHKKIIGFEPQDWAAKEAEERVASYPNCTVLGYGLGIETGTFPMGEWHTDACSFINTGEGSREQGFGYLLDANEFFNKQSENARFNLMMMNIEGYEFLLLPYLRENGWLKKIDRLAVQWHLGLGSDPKTMQDVDEEIEKLLTLDGYKLVYDERPAWTYMEPSWIGGDA